MTTTPTEETTTASTTDTEDVSDATEQRAEDLVGRFRADLVLPSSGSPPRWGWGAMVYIPLWAMRTGLMTRFWGCLGMA